MVTIAIRSLTLVDVVLTFPSVDEFHDVAIQVKPVVDHLHCTILFVGLIRRKCVFFWRLKRW